MWWKSLCKTLVLALVLASLELKAESCVSPESLLELDAQKSQRSQDENLFTKYDQEVEAIKQTLPLNLSLTEQKKLISKQIDELNQKSLQSFLVKASKFSLFSRLSQKTGEQILKKLATHPIAGEQALAKYGENATEIGFCFGRATFVHLELLRAGIQAEKIVKIFAVGGLFNQGVGWDYHVATAFQDNLGFWWVVDSLLTEVYGLQQWMQKISEWDGDQVNPRLRYYFSDAYKFQPQAGYYSLSRFNSDLYRGYFKDLFKWYRTPQNCIKNKLIKDQFDRL